MSNQTPLIMMIAGPNGAGKTTFAKSFLPNEGMLNFVNADLIAAGISPFQPETASLRAGRIMLAELRRLVQLRVDFAFETTLSGQSYATLIRDWQAMGYVVDLNFLKLPSAEMAIQRVEARVISGGHNIPEDVIRRRFDLGWSNFIGIYQGLVDRWRVFDSSDVVPRLVDQGVNRRGNNQDE